MTYILRRVAVGILAALFVVTGALAPSPLASAQSSNDTVFGYGVNNVSDVVSWSILFYSWPVGSAPPPYVSSVVPRADGCGYVNDYHLYETTTEIHNGLYRVRVWGIGGGAPAVCDWRIVVYNGT